MNLRFSVKEFTITTVLHLNDILCKIDKVTNYVRSQVATQGTQFR